MWNRLYDGTADQFICSSSYGGDIFSSGGFHRNGFNNKDGAPLQNFVEMLTPTIVLRVDG